MTGVYGQHVGAYAASGLPAFPVDTRSKRPAVTRWQRTTPSQSLRWARREGLASKDGVGILMGPSSGITEIDIDAVGDAWIGMAIERFGGTPIVIRTASGKGKLWYRHNGERRVIRPFLGLPIDVLGGGFTIAPPSYREDLAASYTFLAGGIAEVANLPAIRADTLAEGFSRAPEAVLRGERNDSLWRYCMTQARFCDDPEALIDVARTWAGSFPDPLPPHEIEKAARSAWRYQIEGRNYLGLKRPQVTESDRIMDALMDQPDAFFLLQLFQRYHWNRPRFAIAPRAMSRDGIPPWHYSRIERARDTLLERGLIEEVIAPGQGKGPGQYRLVNQRTVSVHNHNTPSPPSTYGEVHPALSAQHSEMQL